MTTQRLSRRDEYFLSAFKLLKARGKERIVDLASVAGCSPRTVQSILSSKKAANKEVSEALARYYKTEVELMILAGESISYGGGIDKTLDSIVTKDIISGLKIVTRKVDLDMAAKELAEDIASLNGTVLDHRPDITPTTPEQRNFDTPPYPHNEPHRIPVISWVQAGGWSDAEDSFHPGHADDWHITVETAHQNAFALVIHGDSMEPEFYENEIITIDPGKDPKNGDFIVAKNGNEATFKQLVIDGSSVFLKPLNSRYPIKDMTGLSFVIVGVVVEKRKKY